MTWGEKFPDFIAEAKRQIDEAEEAARKSRMNLTRLEAEQYGYVCGARTASNLDDQGLLRARQLLGRDTTGSSMLTGRYLAYLDEIERRGLVDG